MATQSSKKDPMAWVGLIIILVLILMTVFVLVSSLFNTIGKNSLKGEIDTDTLVANKAAMMESAIKPIGEVSIAGAAPVAAASSAPARSGEEVYNAVCTACHATGVANAPKLDDKAAWEPRIATGFDALLNTAINGKGAMPPRAGQNISDAELTAAIGYMTTKAGFNLDIKAEAAAPAPVATEAAPAEATPAPATEAAAPAEAAPAPAVEEATAPVAPEVPATPETPTTPETPEAPAAPVEEKAAEAASAPEAEVAAAAPSAAGISGEKIYKATCFACHDMGIAGSPKLGDKALWTPRIATGMEALYNSAINGKTSPAGMMPPKGGNTSLSDEETKAAVDYMVSQAQ